MPFVTSWVLAMAKALFWQHLAERGLTHQDRDVMAACSQKLRLSKDELSIARLPGSLAVGLGSWWVDYYDET